MPWLCLFLMTFLEFHFIHGAEIVGETSLPFTDANFLESRMLQSDLPCIQQGPKKKCSLGIKPERTYNLKLDKDSDLSITLDIVNQNADLAITMSSNSILSYDISVSNGNKEKIIRIGTKLSTTLIPKSIIQEYNGGTVYFHTTTETKPANLSVKMNFNDDQDVQDDDEEAASFLVIVLPIAGTILIAVTLAFWCYQRRIQRYRLRRLAHGPDQENGQARIKEGPGVLTENKIDEFFPESKMSEFQTSFAQPACSVCLDEFQQEALCRQLYCQHVFHSECIKVWLVNQLKKGHANCPNCNQSMMKKAESSSPKA